jgi:hypothetical protein
VIRHVRDINSYRRSMLPEFGRRASVIPPGQTGLRRDAAKTIFTRLSSHD